MKNDVLGSIRKKNGLSYSFSDLDPLPREEHHHVERDQTDEGMG